MDWWQLRWIVAKRDPRETVFASLCTIESVLSWFKPSSRPFHWRMYSVSMLKLALFPVDNWGRSGSHQHRSGKVVHDGRRCCRYLLCIRRKRSIWGRILVANHVIHWNEQMSYCQGLRSETSHQDIILSKIEHNPLRKDNLSRISRMIWSTMSNAADRSPNGMVDGVKRRW